MNYNIEEIKNGTKKARLASLLTQTIIKSDYENYYGVGGYAINTIDLFKLIDMVFSKKYIPDDFIKDMFILNRKFDADYIDIDSVVEHNERYKLHSEEQDKLMQFKNTIQISILNTFNFHEVKSIEHLIDLVSEQLTKI